MKTIAPLLLLVSLTTSAIAQDCASGFYLHDALNDSRLQCIVDREPINLALFGLGESPELTIEFDASSSPEPASIQFFRNRAIKSCENLAPWFLDGNNGDDAFSSTNYFLGRNYAAKAFGYDGADCEGEQIFSEIVRFSLIHSPVVDDTDAPTPVPTPGPTSSPTTASDDFKCFETSEELRTAVAAYGTDNSPLTEVAETYGWPIDTWCVDNIEDFNNLFNQPETRFFNEAIGNWNMSNAKDTSNMFRDCESFNQPLGNWDVSGVTSMFAMFLRAYSFNSPIGNWDVSSVENMSFMFSETDYNHPLGEWNVSSVTDMSFMFAEDSSYNHPLEDWDVSSVTTTRSMFNRGRFNFPIGKWDISNIADMSAMFFDSRFGQDLCEWGPKFRDGVNVQNMFVWARCPNDFEDPDLTADPVSPLCFECLM